MPRKQDLTWEPGPRRWRRVYRGKTYTVSCRALGVPAETKAGSYQAANAWWDAKRAEVDEAPPPPPPTWVEEEIAGFRELARDLGPAGEELAARVERMAARIGDPATLWWATPEAVAESRESRAAEEAAAAARREAGAPSLLDQVGEIVARGLYPDGPPSMLEVNLEMAGIAQAAGRVALARRSGPVPADLTIKARVAAYLGEQMARVEAAELSRAEWSNRKLYLGHFAAWAGEGTPIDALDEQRWAAFYHFLLGRVAAGGAGGARAWSKTHADKILRAARAFIDQMVARRLIESPPRNLHDRSMRFTIGPKAIEVFSLEEAGTLVGAATGQLRLLLRLMLNCGMTQQDISDLHPSEVDWRAGAITRKRSKTSGHESVPTVRYILWPDTLSLLRQYRSGDATRLLLTQSGNPWVNDLTGSDSVQTTWRALARKAGVSLTLKHFRKTGATLLHKHREYKSVAGLYLGHSPRSLAERHYTQEDQALLDEALIWLGDHLALPALDG